MTSSPKARRQSGETAPLSDRMRALPPGDDPHGSARHGPPHTHRCERSAVAPAPPACEQHSHLRRVLPADRVSLARAATRQFARSRGRRLPTGLNRVDTSRLRPVGPWCWAWGEGDACRRAGGALKLADVGLVRHVTREARRLPGLSGKRHSPVGARIRLGGVATSCRPCPAYRRAFRRRRRLPSRAARR